MVRAHARKKQIESELRRRWDEGKLELSEDQTVDGWTVHPEPWSLVCFSEEECEAAEDEHELEDLAIDKSGEIAKEEGWDGFVYLYPDESEEDYGLTIFYRRHK